MLNAGQPKIADDWSLTSIPHSDYITLLQQRYQRWANSDATAAKVSFAISANCYTSSIRRSTSLGAAFPLHSHIIKFRLRMKDSKSAIAHC
jgi:hypothetical protein